MCGIAGIIGPGSRDVGLLHNMGNRLAHRGPDDIGVWTDPAHSVGFSHRRLAIVDLSEAGHQPMLSRDERWSICYNGEVYNHLDLRKNLDPDRTSAWRGHSDTETLIEAIAEWGVERTLQEAVGMFAMAVFDRKSGTLFLARDRFGEKPLYYGRAGRDLIFASELKVFHAHPAFEPELDMSAMQSLVSHAVIGGARSIFIDARKLSPGHLLAIGRGTGWSDLPESTPYWSYSDVVRRGHETPFGSREEAIETTSAALRQAVSDQAVADVPVGAFLSGGIDSSLVTSVYQDIKPGKVRTFTIGFDEAGYDESADARRIAEHLGTDHHELRVSSRDARAVIPDLAQIYDEPFADSSQIPTFLVAQMARQHVTVALSGDAGDELFGGYSRHVRLPKLWSIMSAVPRPLRYVGGTIAEHVPSALWDKAIGAVSGGRFGDHLGTKISKFGRLGKSIAGPDELVAGFLDEWSDGRSPLLLANAGEPTRLPLDGNVPLATRLMLADALHYLPDDILCKVDRATMANSLESRVPFLDHRLAEQAARIPASMNIAGGQGKMILRDLLARHVPRALFDRPKAGFAIPIGRWLRHDLRDWAEALLDQRRLVGDGIFDANVVRDRWNRHLSGQIDASQAIWTVLMFQSWKDHWKVS